MVKSYILTRDEQDMALYNEMISSTWEKILLLEKAARNEEHLRPVMDTLNILVEERFNILDMYVILNGQYPYE
jgi:CHASE3 domain sensor protein